MRTPPPNTIRKGSHRAEKRKYPSEQQHKHTRQEERHQRMSEGSQRSGGKYGGSSGGSGSRSVPPKSPLEASSPKSSDGARSGNGRSSKQSGGHGGHASGGGRGEPNTQTPTSTSPTSTFPVGGGGGGVSKEQSLLAAGGMVSIKYFDEASGMWGMRRPAGAANTSQQPKNFAVVNIALGHHERSGSDSDRCAMLGDVLVAHSPTFVAMIEVTESFFAALLQQPSVRRNYAVTDLVKFHCTLDGGLRGADPTVIEHGCLFLIRHNVHVDFAECQPRIGSDKNRPRPYVLLHMRNFCGHSCTVGVAHFDPTGTAQERCTSVSGALGKIDAVDLVVLAGNFGDHVADVKDAELRRDLADVARTHQMHDAYEQCNDTVNTAPVSLWVKQGAKAVPMTVSPLSGDRRWCRFGSLILMSFRGGGGTSSATATAGASAASAAAGGTGAAAASGAGGAATGPIMIPQPRSAKGVKGSPNPTLLADPAVVTVDEKLPAAVVGHPLSSTTSTPATDKGAGGAGSNNSGGSGAAAATTQREGINVAQLFPAAALTRPRQARFRKDSAFHMKGSNRNLSTEEAWYDLSNHFSSVTEAIDTINSGGFPWVADFFVVNSTILAAEHVSQCDLKAFRRYVQSKANPWTLLKHQLTSGGSGGSAGSNNNNNTTNGGEGERTVSGGAGVNVAQLLVERVVGRAGDRGDDDAPVARSAARPSTSVSHHASTAAATHHGPVSRPRVWSESCCTLLHQLTPREMRFDISPLVGVGRGNLKSAIARLNTKKTMAAALSEKPDPLLDYGYDYALLYCAERQGYWLLAASDVPCDIVSCRQAAL